MHSRMNDQITINDAVAIASAGIGVALVIATIAIPRLEAGWACLGLVFTTFAALRSVWGWLADLREEFQAVIRQREINAFEIGRDFEAARTRRVN